MKSSRPEESPAGSRGPDIASFDIFRLSLSLEGGGGYIHKQSQTGELEPNCQSLAAWSLP